MQLVKLEVQNFRAITSVSLHDLEQVVVIAGPNGCGKSCILDAIRLLKSAYGGYQQDEWQSWFGEFQVSLDREAQELLSLFQDRSHDIRIAATVRFNEVEKAYLRRHLRTIVTDKLWSQVFNRPWKAVRLSQTSLAENERIHGARIEREASEAVKAILPELDLADLNAVVTIPPEGRPTTHPSRLLEVVFSTYEPRNLGVLDYHGPTRNYERERIGNINLTIESVEKRQRQHALYNYANKYKNLKSEMAAEYVRRQFAKEANPKAPAEAEALIESLKELFATFFPGKQFRGPQPTSDGRLLFPVTLPSGGEHDIDDLSSGEKEVLYGYLRLRISASRNSILLIDEPELHLNPRLVSGLASFYYKHLGANLGNQLWLVTHSDTLIREAVARGGFSVFHIHVAGSGIANQQAARIRADDELERLIIDLIGDLAAYRPGSKVVIFESTEDAAFDMRMTKFLFPQFDQQTTCISGGNKERVADLYELLERMRCAGQLHLKFYPVTDRDDDDAIAGPDSRLQWDVYHIENFLLVPRYILQVCREVNVPTAVLPDEEATLQVLQVCAKETIQGLVAHRVRKYVNRKLVSALDLRVDPTRADVAKSFSEAIAHSSRRVQQRIESELGLDALTTMEDKFRREYEVALTDGSWVRKFRGRDVLRRFVGRTPLHMQYEPFRDLVLARMRDENYQPEGMRRVIQRILRPSCVSAG
jgi:predicted ATPase